MALGVREAVLDSGLNIPENMALTGFDDIAFSATKGVELTTIRQKKYDMGTLAVEVLVKKIEKRSPPAVTQITLEPEIIIRNSCGHGLYGYRNEKSLNISVSQKNRNVQIGHLN
jgi:DNA-binding LacI/PurR family transcriptional regulator